MATADGVRTATNRVLLRARRPAAAAWLARLRDESRLARPAMEQLQRERLGALLAHAATHVPRWRDWFAAAGIDAAAAATPAGFSTLPVTSRADIQHEGARLWSDDHATRGSFMNSSGGSTGEPVRVRQDRAYADAAHAVKLLWDEWAGYETGARKAVVWGSERDLFHGNETWRGRVARRLRGEQWLNAFRMTLADMDAFLADLAAAPPRLLLGYANSLYELARHAEAHGRTVRGVGAVMSSAGTLFPRYREAIGHVFGAPVFDRYGCRELGDPASERRPGAGQHVCESLYVVEVVAADGAPCAPGVTGRLLLTCLVNYAMPLIRYDIGDLATWHESSEPVDGVTWRRLREIGGRTIETIVRPDGGVVSPIYFIHLLGVTLERGWLRRYQFVQEAPAHLRVRLVPQVRVADPATAHADALAEIATKVRAAIGAQVRVDFEFPEEIAPSASGKYQYVVSRVSAGASHGA